MSTETAPAALLPQLAVPCTACGAEAGALCTSHSGTRQRRHDTHQARSKAYNARKDAPR